MKVFAISSIENAKELLCDSQAKGYLTFVYHHADPKRELLNDKFLYVHSDEELIEKVKLVQSDFTIQDLIKR